MMNGEIIEGASVDLVPVDHHAPANLFRTEDPVQVIEKASKVADALKNVIVQKGLTSTISGREHVRVEGWTTCGAMLGVVPIVTWTRPVEDGWEARVEARTLDGRVVGAAEAQCTRSEKTWKSRDDYALRSMAQTRAVSKALRGPLGFILTLAGFEVTPAEEMPEDALHAPTRAENLSAADVNKLTAELDLMPDPYALLTGCGAPTKSTEWTTEHASAIRAAIAKALAQQTDVPVDQADFQPAVVQPASVDAFTAILETKLGGRA